MDGDTGNKILERIHAGDPPGQMVLADLDESRRSRVIDRLIADPDGRRWLREHDGLGVSLADQLIEYEQDFNSRRRDRSLANVVHSASLEALDRHTDAVVESPAVEVYWARLADDPDRLTAIAVDVVQRKGSRAGEATLYLLVLDPVDSRGLDELQRREIAEAGLSSVEPRVRGLAAEFLAGAAPDVLLSKVEHLIRDENERVRGFTWSAAFQRDSQRAYELALKTLGDELRPVDERRSALLAAGEHMPTSAITDLLSFFVVHPDPGLATDAANLLYRLHRQPEIATAASQSPHENVRETAEKLLDPYRGSPAAGGSRPGDPTRSDGDVFAEMLRRLGDESDPTNQ